MQNNPTTTDDQPEPKQPQREDQDHVQLALPNAADAAHDRKRVAELEDEIAELSAHIDAATARLLAAIAEFDSRCGWGDAGCVSCAQWLSFRVGLTLTTAREKVRVARALVNLPRTYDALAHGRISYSKVRELTRVATPENEEELVELAQAGTASQFQRIVRAYRRAEQAELDVAQRQREGRYLSLRTDDDGMLVLEGRLPPEVGALLKRAVEAAEQELRQRANEAPARARLGETSAEARPGETPAQARPGETSAQARPGETSAQAHDQDITAHDTAGTPSQRRADALGLVARRALADARTGKHARSEPCQVVLHVDAAVLSGQQTEGSPTGRGRCHLEDGPALAAETARRLSCDAPTVTLAEDAHGQPLDVGRKSRRVSTALHRALRARDQTCQFPGCDKTGHLTPHHVTHWAAGGPTDKDNLVMLCNAHHWAVHEGGCEVRGHAPDALSFFNAGGIELKAQPAPPPALPADPVGALKAQHVAEGLEISPVSNVITWQGERWDLGWAVESLLSCREVERKAG